MALTIGERVLERPERFAGFVDTVERIVGGLRPFRVADEFAVVRANELVRGSAADPAVRVVDARIHALQIELEVAIFDPIEDFLRRLLGFVQSCLRLRRRRDVARLRDDIQMLASSKRRRRDLDAELVSVLVERRDGAAADAAISIDQVSKVLLI